METVEVKSEPPEDSGVALIVKDLVEEAHKQTSAPVVLGTRIKVEPGLEDLTWRQISLVPYEVVSGTDTEDSESDSESSSSSSDSVSSSSSSSDSSSDSDTSGEDEESDAAPAENRPKSSSAVRAVKKRRVRTYGELSLEDLPPIEELHISVPKAETLQIGIVHAIVDRLVIVQSFPNTPPLDLDSVLLRDEETALGQVFDVLGPVICPLYAVRFNSAEDIVARGIMQGDAVYCAPQHRNLTNFVFVEQLTRIKGSDASWENNNEPPEECLEYSDDEQEKRAKKQAKAQAKAQAEGQSDATTTDGDILSPAEPMRKRACWRGKRGRNNPNFRHQQQTNNEKEDPRPVVHPPTFTSSKEPRPAMEGFVRSSSCFGPPRMGRPPPQFDARRARNNPFYMREDQFRPRFGEARPQFGPPPFHQAFENNNGPPPPPPSPSTNPFSVHFPQFQQPPPPPTPPPPPPTPPQNFPPSGPDFSSSFSFTQFPPPFLPSTFFSPPPPPPPLPQTPPSPQFPQRRK